MDEKLLKKLNERPDELTEEEIGQIMKEMQDDDPDKDKKPPEPKPPERVSIRLDDGSIVEGKDYEEVSKLLTAKLAEYREPDKTVEPPKTPDKPEWDFKKFEQTFLKDPREALDYADRSQFGVPVRHLIPQLVAVVGAMAQRLQQGEAQRFLDTNPDYLPCPENQRVIENVLAERGWQPSYQTLSDAYAIAKAGGKLREKKPAEKQEYVPPRPKSGGQEEVPDNLTALAEGMSTEKLEELLIKAGHLHGRVFTR